MPHDAEFSIQRQNFRDIALGMLAASAIVDLKDRSSVDLRTFLLQKARIVLNIKNRTAEEDDLYFVLRNGAQTDSDTADAVDGTFS